MKTIICDIDGTLTSLWPVEKAVLTRLIGAKADSQLEQVRTTGLTETLAIYRRLSKSSVSKIEYLSKYNQIAAQLLNSSQLPNLASYWLVKWIKRNARNYNFIYATGGQRLESHYALTRLELIQYFDLVNSVDKTNCRFSKRTGIPFRKIMRKFPDCVLVTDSQSDVEGARKVGIRAFLITRQPAFSAWAFFLRQW